MYFGCTHVLRKLRATVTVMVAGGLCFVQLPAYAAPIEVTDLLNIDALGYRCIPAMYFEDGDDGSAAIAFTLSGKTRLPRTCLPDPCARALTQQELSQVTGTETMLAKFSEEWDDYYARYADHCRREVTVSRPRGPGVVGQPTSSRFWPPILERARIIQQVGVPTVGQGGPSIIEGVNVPQQNAGDTPIDVFIQTLPPETPDIAPIPSPVPLPASGLMLAALLGVGILGRRRKRAV